MKIAGAHVVFHRLLKTSSRHSLCAVLLCKRTQSAPTYPGYWSLFGGSVDSGERARQAAVREIREELGISLRAERLNALCDIRIQRGKDRPVLGVRFFSSALDVDMDRLTLKRHPDDEMVEGEGLGWFTAGEIHHMMVRPEDRAAIGIFFAKYGI